MTNHEMRIAVAEAVGWKQYHEKGGTDRGITDWEGYDPTGKFVIFEDLPDYTSDLNAMHEAEKTLTFDQQDTYWCLLRHSVSAGLDDMQHCFNTLHSTAAQRAESFLKAIGKWKPEPTP